MMMIRAGRYICSDRGCTDRHAHVGHAKTHMHRQTRIDEGCIHMGCTSVGCQTDIMLLGGV